MKDILAKLTELEKSSPKIKKQNLLTEDSAKPPVKAETKPSRLKDIFESLSVGQKPLPVLDKENGQKQAGAGFLNITDNSPSSKAIQKAVGDLAATGKAQIVMPNQNANNNRMSSAGAPNPNTQQSIGSTQVTNEKWDTKTEVSPSEKGKYEGKTKAELTKEYNKLKSTGPHKQGSKEFSKMKELAFAIRAKSDWGKVQEENISESLHDDVSDGNYEKGHRIFEISEEIKELTQEAYNLCKDTQEQGRAHSYWYPHIMMALDDNHGYMGKNMYTMAGSAESLMSADDDFEDDDITTEADIPSSKVDMGAGLGAGRSKTTFENKGQRK